MSVFLHIGAPKTGTTYLQHVLSQNRRALARAGVSYPGSGADHFHAAQDLLGVSFAGWHDPRTDGAWRRLVAEVDGWQGRHCVISHELLAWAGPDAINTAVEAFAAHDLHVVYTVRDLGRLVPAMWQESLKNRGVVPLRKALRRMRNQAGSLGKGTSSPARAVNPAGVLERWASALEPERIHVLVLGKDPPPDQLWRDFAGLLGVEPTECATSAPANASLGAAEAELLRRLNQLLGKDVLDWPDYDRLIKNELVPRVLAPEATTRITLPPEDHSWVTEWAQGQVEALRAAGYDVVGDLEEIIPAGQAEPPPKPREAEINRAATQALAHLVRRLARAEDPRRALDPIRRGLARARGGAHRALRRRRAGGTPS